MELVGQTRHETSAMREREREITKSYDFDFKEEKAKDKLLIEKRRK